jgi:hypothetical protein
MAQDIETFNKELYDLLKVRGYQPSPLDSKNQRVPASQEADVMEFTFIKDGKDYGKVWISIDESQNIIVYYDEEQQESPSNKTAGAEYDDTWTGFLKHLKQWALRRQLSFELSNKDRLGDDMRQREYYKTKAKLGEGYYPIGKKASYNDAVPNVKIILQHNRALEEGEKRYRNVAKIFLENTEGERFLAPTNRPGLARVYARHIAEGGLPNDEKWNHIKQICEEYSKMAGFVRATKNKQFNENALQLVNEGLSHYNNLRETLHKLTTHRGYHTYFESYTPTLMEDELDESINELFVQEKIDPRIENAMPILAKLKKGVSEMKEIDSLAEWADDVINEKLELDEAEQVNELSTDTLKSYKKKAGKQYDAITGGEEGEVHPRDFMGPGNTMDKRAKGINIANKKLNKSVDEAKASTTTFKKIDDYATWHDNYLMRMRAEYDEVEIDGMLVGIAWTDTGVRGIWYNKQRFGTISSKPVKDELIYVETDPNSPWLNEGLDANQKRVGQLGPTEKVGKKGAVGKLVGANESTEIDPELARIMEMARFKR